MKSRPCIDIHNGEVKQIVEVGRGTKEVRRKRILLHIMRGIIMQECTGETD